MISYKTKRNLTVGTLLALSSFGCSVRPQKPFAAKPEGTKRAELVGDTLLITNMPPAPGPAPKFTFEGAKAKVEKLIAKGPLNLDQYWDAVQSGPKRYDFYYPVKERLGLKEFHSFSLGEPLLYSPTLTKFSGNAATDKEIYDGVVNSIKSGLRGKGQLVESYGKEIPVVDHYYWRDITVAGDIMFEIRKRGISDPGNHGARCIFKDIFGMDVFGGDLPGSDPFDLTQKSNNYFWEEGLNHPVFQHKKQ